MQVSLENKGNNRLKTGRVALIFFLILLIVFSVMYKMTRTANHVLVKIEHVFEPEKKKGQKPVKKPEASKKAMPQKTVKKDKKQQAAVKLTAKAQDRSRGKKNPAKDSGKTVKAPVRAEKKSAVTAKLSKPSLPVHAGVQLVSEKMKTLINRSEPKPVSLGKPLILDSKTYFDLYDEWQASGNGFDMKKKLVALRIVNLENVYDLFQMKVVAIKQGVPHMDLTDHSRVAASALSEFSTTCFVVSDPWEKWGDALKASGYHKNDDIQVRYYTYDFVRNAIYARAMKAFEWSLKQKNLPDDTDPGTADVLGVVYAVKKDSGGAFGIFVPTRVDFVSHGSVIVDPRVCFAGQKDIEALKRAGLL